MTSDNTSTTEDGVRSKKGHDVLTQLGAIARDLKEAIRTVKQTLPDLTLTELRVIQDWMEVMELKVHKVRWDVKAHRDVKVRTEPLASPVSSPK
jgi:hypothetical protein